jgi:hypothetical protein
LATSKKADVEYEHDTKRYEDYLDERKGLVEAKRQLSMHYDNLILGLASGAIGVSIAFMKDIVPRGPEPGSTPWLVAAWISLVVCIGALALSFWASQRSYKLAIDDLDASHQPGAVPAQPTDAPWWSSATRNCNLIAIVSFVLGVALLTTFVGLNLPVRAAPASTSATTR